MSNADTKADVTRGEHEVVAPPSISSQFGHFITWKRANRQKPLLHEAGYLLLGLLSLVTVTGVYFWLDVPLVAAAFTYLIVVVLLSLVSNFSSLIVLSFIGVCCLSYFFAPPIYSFRVDYTQDLITISAFVMTSFVVNFLVTRVRVEQRGHMRTSETLRDANQRLEAANKALRIENEERKRAEQALRESEDKLREIFGTEPGIARSKGSEGKKAELPPGFMKQLQAILNVLPAYIWYGNPSGSLLFVNKQQADFLGVPKDNPLRFGIDVGAQWDDWVPLLHPDEHEEARKYWSNCLRTSEGGEHNYRVRDAQGNYRWFLTHAEPLRASDGTLLLWIGTTLDIEEYKRAEQAVRESEYKLRQIVETIPSLVWSLAPDGEPTHFNPRLLDYFGKSFEDFAHGGWLALVHPDDRSETEKIFSHGIQTGTPYQIVNRLRRADGEFRWHHTRGEPLRDGQGRVVQWYGVSVDIDEAKKAEERLRRSESYLAEAQRLGHNGVAAYNDTTILYGSDETFRIWGFDPAQGVPSREAVFQRIHPDDREQLNAEVQRAVVEKRGYSNRYRIVLPDGTVKHVETIGQPVFSAGGELVEIVTTQVDVTERKRAEEALRESEYKLRQIVETIPTLVWSADPNFEATHLNQRHLDYYGKQLEDFKHGGWKAFQHPDDLAESAKAISHAVQTGTSFHAVHRIRRADGEFRWHDSRAEPLRDEQGNIIQWYGLTIDIDEAKKAEERLRRSEAHLTEAQRLSHTGSSVYNKTTILYWSEETYRIWGFDPLHGPPTREAVSQRIHPDERDSVRAGAQRALDQKEGYSIGFRIVLSDGTLKHLEVSSHPAFSASGELVEVVATHVDVTERKRAEQALRESEAKIRRLVDANIIGIVIWDFDGRIIEANDAFLRMVDYDREDLVAGRIRWTELTPAEWRERDEQAATELHLTGTFQPFEKEFIQKTGSRVPVLIGLATFEGGGNQGVAFVLDLTERKCAEKALQESERSARSALDGIAGLVAVLAPNGELDAINRQVIEYFGRSLEEMKNWGTSDAVHPEDIPRVVEIFQRSIATGTPFHYELRLRHSDGEYRWFDNRCVPIRDDTGRIVRWYMLGTDIEDRKQALTRLDQMQSDFAHINRVSMMGELAASLSHEITQPIASARNNARAAQNFLDKRPPALREVREALGGVVGDADRAGDIVDRIRDHVKKAPPRKERVDLNQAITDVIVLAQGAIIKNGISVQTRLTERLPHVQADCVQLQQVVLNLTLNAVEAMGSVTKGARELSISTEQNEVGGVLVAVRDSGPGIDPEHLDHVFDAFYTTKSSGVGMGLSICRSIIDAHGGRLWADVNESGGAVFQFTLPAVT